MVGLSIGFALTFVVAIPLVWVTFLWPPSSDGSSVPAAALLDVNLPTPRRRSRQLVEPPAPARDEREPVAEIAYLVVGLPASARRARPPPAVGVLGGAARRPVLRRPPGRSVGRLRPRPYPRGVGRGGRRRRAGRRPRDRAAGHRRRRPRRPGGRPLAPRPVAPGRADPAGRRARDEPRRRGRPAEADRRQIERDLHDGAQQRLVALAMDLGRARSASTPTRPGPASSSTRPTRRRRRPSASSATSPAASIRPSSPTAASTPRCRSSSPAARSRSPCRSTSPAAHRRRSRARRTSSSPRR